VVYGASSRQARILNTLDQENMARYMYWMVYLPALCPESFLLFVNDSLGQTKLRDYSGGKGRVLRESPSSVEVNRATELGATRFQVKPRVTTDDYFWFRLTVEHNTRHLPTSHTSAPIFTAPTALDHVIQASNVKSGRARRGSQRQLQDYVNEHEAILTNAFLEALPPRFQESGATIEWLSPLAQNGYIEYRDAEFLRVVKLGKYTDKLANFWPLGGPCWDALALISASENQTTPGVILVEAKSHISEIYGSGCQASSRSRELILKSFTAAKQWCGVNLESDWTGPLYQSANRLAHLYFLREVLGCSAWLVNLYFLNDSIGPADEDDWRAELVKVKTSLGLTSSLPFAIDVFLPALPSGDIPQPVEHRIDSANPRSHAAGEAPPLIEMAAFSHAFQDNQIATRAEDTEFAMWADQWMTIAKHTGPFLDNIAGRVERLVQLWKEPIPGQWKRGKDSQLMGPRYRRGNLDKTRQGEHAIEYEILVRQFGGVTFDGYKLLDGVNALPLVRDSGGGRRANVEADMFLLGEHKGTHRLFLCEVKESSNTAWFAAVENLRQLRLLTSCEESLVLFARRDPSLNLPLNIPVTALVVAPPLFYSSRGQKANAVTPALNLLARFNAEFGVDARLAVWDSIAIEDWRPAGVQ
jgi:hypothetical protein